jgi:hypothetical protein
MPASFAVDPQIAASRDVSVELPDKAVSESNCRAVRRDSSEGSGVPVVPRVTLFPELSQQNRIAH